MLGATQKGRSPVQRLQAPPRRQSPSHRSLNSGLRCEYACLLPWRLRMPDQRGAWPPGPSRLVIEFVRGEALRKTALCAEVLADARKLMSSRRSLPLLRGLVKRAHELLDAVDE